jgi:hypothetical protein
MRDHTKLRAFELGTVTLISLNNDKYFRQDYRIDLIL